VIDPDLRRRADAFLAPAMRQRFRNAQVRPHWVGPDRFWWRQEVPGGSRIMMVDAETGRQTEVSDQEAIAEAVGLPGEVLSPDGRLAVFRREHDLWLRETASGVERRLTFDGAEHCAWGKSPDSNLTTVSLKRRGLVLPANAMWSADGTRVFTSRLDERAVKVLPLVQHVPDDGSVRPVLHTLRFAFSGDEGLPVETHAVIEVASGRVVVAQAGPHVTGMTTAIEKEEAWWSADGSRVWFLDRDRFWQRLSLWEMDAATGAVREVVRETAETFIDTNHSVLGLPNIRVLEDRGEVLWFSQRDGWGHLYRYDLASGALKNQVTSGEWLVRDVLHVEDGQVELLAGGMQPNLYHRTLCRVGLDGTGLQVLTPGDEDQLLAMPMKRVPRDHIRPPMPTGHYRAPDGRFFVHTRADLESLPVSELRRADGSLVAVLATAELDEGPWRWPTPFTVVADDGHTTLFGAMWLPTDFDPAKRYPVIDYIYPGPQRGQLPTVMLTDVMGELGRTALPQAFAELGFVVLNIEGRGTPLRSKAFHDESYGRLETAGTLADHVAALQQLGAQHAFLDLGRVGIMGHSGGGYATVKAMTTWPEVFHAGIATAGNHDQMGYSFAWTEKYMGPIVPVGNDRTSWSGAANPPFAANIKGKLLLATGDMDDNVHPALTMQLAAALIAADRDFEFIPLPNDDHTTVWGNPYFLRRAYDFMLRAMAVN
jgi:dipeptidyl aminopeptidase/acylaminoacyl peptidase